MKNGKFKSRGHQIQSEVRAFRAGKISLKNMVKNISFEAICAERDRTLEIVSSRDIRDQICAVSCLEVLNIEN